MGNLILGIIKLAQPGRCCRPEKQEEQMQHDVVSPALYESHLHSWGAGAMHPGRALHFSEHPTFPQQWQHLTIAAASKTTEGNSMIYLNHKIELAVDFWAIITYLRLPLDFNHPRSAIISQIHALLWLTSGRKWQWCINKLCFPHVLGSGMGPGSPLMPSVGSSAENSSLLLPLPAQRYHKVTSKHTASNICWLDTCMHSWEMERSFSAVPPLEKITLCGRKQLNIDHQSKTAQSSRKPSNETRKPQVSVTTISSLLEIALMSSQQGIAAISFSLCWSFSRGTGCLCWILN